MNVRAVVFLSCLSLFVTSLYGLPTFVEELDLTGDDARQQRSDEPVETTTEGEEEESSSTVSSGEGYWSSSTGHEEPSTTAQSVTLGLIDSDLEGSDQGMFNAGLFQGDIVLAPSMQKNAIRNANSLWPHGTIVYTVDNTVGCPDSAQCRMLKESMDQIAARSCIRFKQWTGEPNRVHIFVSPDSGACWSPVGRTGAQVQTLSLGTSCWYRGIVLHELLHAVGFWHEMTRPDRDAFISIYWSNILPGFSSAFYKQEPTEVDTLGEKFDYKSVMMYDEYAFSKDGVSATLQATNPGVIIGPIWKKMRLSRSDTKRLHRLYTCQGTRSLPGFPYDVQCSFNDHPCGFKNGGAPHWTWRRVTDNSGFVYTSWERAGINKGYIQSATLHPSNPEGPEMGCVRFSYYMDGNSRNTYLRLLHAYVDSANAANYNPATAYELWSSDVSSQSWRFIQLPLYLTRPFKLLFESSFGVDSTDGSIGIDDVELFYSPCPSAAGHQNNPAIVKWRSQGHQPLNLTLIDVPLD